jgi:Fur family transcriptional regulator, ferric uptake regulator
MDAHERIAREFEPVFLQDGFGRIDERSRILEAFLRHEDHISADRLAKEFADQGPSLEPAFVERVLEQFVRYGLAMPILGEDGHTRFEHLHVGRHHDHIICVNCGRVEEVEAGLHGLIEALGGRTGFQALHAHLQVHGLCPACAEARSKRFALTRVTGGERVQVVEITGGQALHQQLGGMGIHVGVILRRANSGNPGPVLARRRITPT